jgi:hypothetical protein
MSKRKVKEDCDVDDIDDDEDQEFNDLMVNEIDNTSEEQVIGSMKDKRHAVVIGTLEKLDELDAGEKDDYIALLIRIIREKVKRTRHSG